MRETRPEEEKKALEKARRPLLDCPWNLTDADHRTLEDLEQANDSIFRGDLLEESFAGVLGGRSINLARGFGRSTSDRPGV